MKKLILYDHLGVKVLEQDVFVEGADFEWGEVIPRAYWLGKILLVDKEPEPIKPEPELVSALEKDATEALTEEEEIYEAARADQPEPDEIPREQVGTAEGMKEITEALDEIQEIEEVISEPKAVSDKGTRKPRTRKAK